MIIVNPLAGAGGYSDVVMDLRVNDNPLPLVELRRLLTVFRSRSVIRRANAVYDQGDQQGALDIMLELRDAIPEKDQVWVALARLYLQMNRKTDALAAIERAVEINPRNKGQLTRNAAFQALHFDPDFLRLVR